MNTVNDPAKVKEILNKVGVSHARVAKDIGISRSYLSLILNERIVAPGGVFTKICAYAQRFVDAGLAA